MPYGGAMGVKDQLRAAIDSLSEEEAAAVLLVLQRERDDIQGCRDRQALAHAHMREAMTSAEALADDD